ncbi:MAG: HK97 family phage prohead protease [Bacillota bacterium]
MPLPQPKDNEDKDSFIRRCMADETMTSEYPDEKQRYAVCLAQYQDKKRTATQIPREIRMVEVRAMEPTDGKEMTVEGRAIVYDRPTVLFEVDGIKYHEVIVRGALDQTDLRDVAFKYNHSDAVMIMARTRNKTLELIRDEQGLLIRARLANTSAGHDLYELIRRGDIDQMSFGFTIAEDAYERETRTRKILAIKRIWEVSAVDAAAYPDTYIAARSYFEAQAEAERRAAEAAETKRRQLIVRTYL